MPSLQMGQLIPPQHVQELLVVWFQALDVFSPYLTLKSLHSQSSHWVFLTNTQNEGGLVRKEPTHLNLEKPLRNSSDSHHTCHEDHLHLED